MIDKNGELYVAAPSFLCIQIYEIFIFLANFDGDLL